MDSSANVLIVVAHPDDEVLGAGGAASTWTDQGARVQACILSGGVTARRHRPPDADLVADTASASAALGMPAPFMGAFPNIAMNTVPHIELVQFIESAIEETGAQYLITHHPNDLNDDHRQTSAAAQAAARLSSRRPGLPALLGLHYMEVPSSTDWAFVNASAPFRPNAYVELGETGLQRKLDALACYRDVMRPFPHPRSHEVIRALATVRGGEAHLLLAEAFETTFHRLHPIRVNADV